VAVWYLATQSVHQRAGALWGMIAILSGAFGMHTSKLELGYFEIFLSLLGMQFTLTNGVPMWRR
jgi:hypothetical protein